MSLKVLFVVTGLGAGGAERMLLKVATQLRGKVHATVVTLTDYDDLEPLFQRAGISVSRIGMRGPSSALNAVIRLARLIRKHRPDVVSTWMYHADLVGGLAARLAGVRGVAWNIRNSTLSVQHTPWTTRLVVWMGARLSRLVPRVIICCSETSASIHGSLGYDSSRMRVVPNGFDLDQFRPDPIAAAAVRAELGIPAGAPLIGQVARWHPQKDHRCFVEAAARLHRRRPDVCFLLVGEGCGHANVELTQWIREAGLTQVFRRLDLRTDVPRLTAALDIATLSSSFGEAFPNVLGEAMACGVPCVATDVGDAIQIVGDTGLVVPPGSPEALAAGWVHVLGLTPAARSALGEAARARVLERFEIGAVAQRYEACFLELAEATREANPCAV